LNRRSACPALAESGRGSLGAPAKGGTQNQREEEPQIFLQISPNFCQVFANFPLASPNISKLFFGGFLGYQGFTRRKKRLHAIPNFFASRGELSPGGCGNAELGVAGKGRTPKQRGGGNH
jgi:hypothetical protein